MMLSSPQGAHAVLLGCYANIAPSTARGRHAADLTTPATLPGRLLFVGEHTCERRTSTVDSAWITGVREASRLLQRHQVPLQRGLESPEPRRSAIRTAVSLVSVQGDTKESEIAMTSTTLTRRARWLPGAAAVASILMVTAATPAHAADGGNNLVVAQTNLVANRAGFDALTVDPNLQNAWGMSKLPTSPVWVSDNGADVTTLYAGGSGAPSPVTVVPLVVSVPNGPTGQVSNTTSSFVLSSGGAARFVFVNEAGEVWAWNPSKGTTAEMVTAVPGAVYKGLAMGVLGGNPVLYAANFERGRVDVFDGSWNLLTMPDAFQVPDLPAGFSPFNVQVLRDGNGVSHLFVAYAQHVAGELDEAHGKRLGLVVEFTANGTMVREFERPAALNAPWGLAYAPPSWGRVAGMLLVGQFGDGRIETFDPATGEYAGPLRATDHHPVVIDGLWALMAGDATAGGVGSILFTAGPNDEEDGLYGVLTRG